MDHPLLEESYRIVISITKLVNLSGGLTKHLRWQRNGPGRLATGEALLLGVRGHLFKGLAAQLDQGMVLQVARMFVSRPLAAASYQSCNALQCWRGSSYCRTPPCVRQTTQP